ncbi:MAG TPA: hypothetical protein VN253_25305 [Kofleriaceae bacterium]|nr:hypothetical protein [Kofleriaceae bacterium]
MRARPGRSSPLLAGALAASLALAAGCQDSVTTPFPPGLEPFSDNDVPGDLPGDRAEVLHTSSSSSGMIRVYGRGFVLAPPSVLWRVAQVPEGMAARCNTTRQMYTLSNEPEHELSFLVHYVVDDILTVEWDDQWRGDVIEVADDAPRLAMIKHQKVEGSDFIDLSEGSIQLRATDDPEVSELWFVEHLHAISGSASDVTGGMQDNYDALVALAHDRPIPPCR